MSDEPKDSIDNLNATPCNLSDCSLPVDVVFQSSDGILFGGHSRNLEIYSSGFPPSGFGSTTRDIVHLPESSEVIKLLLQYMHHRPQPDSDEIPFNVLKELAEAVEKYGVYSAMEVCKIRMKEATLEHPLEVLTYAARHGYTQICDEAATKTLSHSLQNVEAYVGDRTDIFMAWIRYRECWLELRQFIHGNQGGCDQCARHYQAAIMELGTDLGNLVGIGNVLAGRGHCREGARTWVSLIKNRLSSIPKFSSFM